jgi:hypothetical protein
MRSAYGRQTPPPEYELTCVEPGSPMGELREPVIDQVENALEETHERSVRTFSELLRASRNGGK